MYVTTFYSYKGGVGRTMALINVAKLLAKSEKRVLVVDFDLEAPGLPSFETFRCAASRPGIVDYVCAYRDSGSAPDVTDYLVECTTPSDQGIWLMPAGRHTQAGYGEKLNSIDWKELYDSHSGFLMFEDLRYQWANHPAKFDYVLIDSRTGHTDVGGICTRQLPDAVVIMFLPNEQNIEGLRPIVAAIREEAAVIGGRKIDLHFCPSNVPDLDDENEILRKNLTHAEEALDYQKPSAVLEHYNSMDLLAQPVFTQTRPRSKLSQQYQELLDAIIQLNYDDRAGADLALRKMPKRYENARRHGDQRELQDIEAAVSRIAAHHPGDGQIGWRLSILYGRMGALEEEREALTLAIEQGYERNRAILRRARVQSLLGEKQAARDDIVALLRSGTATAFDVMSAIDLLPTMEENWVAPIQLAVDQLDSSQVSALLPSLMNDRGRLPMAVNLARRALANGALDARDNSRVETFLVLGLIGLGYFQDAIDVMTKSGTQSVPATPHNQFNYAVAQWGLAGEPSVELFERVLATIQQRPMKPDANLYQCTALAQMVTGRRDEAAQSLEAARNRARTGVLIFSCWRYLEVSGATMLADLTEMAQALSGNAVEPKFFDEVKRLVS